jgi:Fic family protein
LERDKFKYYNLLNGIRTKNDWGSWIAFFLKTVAQQCKKYIDIIDQINELYENDLELAKKIIKSNKVVDLINLLYTYPIITANIVTQKTDIPPATATRYLNALAEAEILYMDSNKLRNKTFYYYDLLNVLR